jgi:saccharopine dehydrogenase (NAD+, L-lysine forming)
MKVLIVGSGGVGESTTAIAKRRDPNGELFETMVLADYDLAKSQAASSRMGDETRFPAEQVNAADVDAVVALCAKYDVDVLCSFLPVEFNPFTLQAALKARVHHMDASTTLSQADPVDPYNKANVVLGQDELEMSAEFEKIGKLGLMGMGVEPGMADWYCRYAADHFFDEIDEIGVRDGANLEIPGFKGISFGFSIWMTIEECTNPAVVWERDRGFYTVPPLSDPEPFYLPEGIGWVEVAHVEHEEVVHVGYFEHLLKGVKKATFKYALGDEFIQAMDVFRSVNLHSLQPVKVRGGAEVRPRDLVEAAAPDPNEIGKRYVGQSCAGTWVRGRKDGREREVYLYQVVDNQDCVGLYGTQGVVAQTAFPGVIALELLATGKLAGYKGNPEAGVFPAQAFTCDDFVSLQKEYEFPGGVLEMDSEYKRELDHAGFTAPVAGDGA